ncbi:MAG: glutathione S-transferase C-terminal domain-containing protein, partial [Methylobacterium mesophilicum]|nr:glutathione S-transferase C-terminal domain-containing protein [Methylobacterium mesophilicum]
HVIIDYLDGQAPEGARLAPAQEPDRHRALRIVALATGLADKAVALFYELRLHERVSEVWQERCRAQVLSTLDVLEADKAGRESPFWFGERIGHADIAVAAALRHAGEAHPDLIRLEGHPALRRHAETMEAMPVFREISQPFIAPA